MRNKCLRHLALQEEKGMVWISDFKPFDTDKCEGLIPREESVSE